LRVAGRFIFKSGVSFPLNLREKKSTPKTMSGPSFQVMWICWAKFCRHKTTVFSWPQFAVIGAQRKRIDKSKKLDKINCNRLLAKNEKYTKIDMLSFRLVLFLHVFALIYSQYVLV